MRFSIITQAIIASLAAFASADDCSEGPWAESGIGGVMGGGLVCDSKWSDGETIIGLRAWSAKFQMKAIQFKFSQSGWGPVRGKKPDGSSWMQDEAEWAVGDEVCKYITSLACNSV